MNISYSLTHRIASYTLAVLAIMIFPTTPAFAQNDTVTVSAVEFQRMTYAAHLLTQLTEKPELEVTLEVLLALQRRNPAGDSVGLATICREALTRYRATAAAHIRAGSRDEILAAYLEAFKQVPGRTNYAPANFTLLYSLISRSSAPASEPQADLINSGSCTLLGSEGNLSHRQALLDGCTERAQKNGAFRASMDALLMPDVLFSVSDTPAAIIGSTNSPLHGNPTMETLLALSLANGGALTVASNQLMNLFAGETQTFWDAIHTNLALQIEISRNQSDLLAYLTNQAAVNGDAQRLADATRGQTRNLASASAAVLVQSKLQEARDPLIQLPGQMKGCMEGLGKIAEGLGGFAEDGAFKKLAGSANILSGALGIFNTFFGGESSEEQIGRELGNIKTLIGDLSTNMNYRFDRVDQSLVTMYQTLNEVMDKIVIIDGRIDHIDGTLDEIRLSLLDMQTGLLRIERNLATYHALALRLELLQQMNLGLGYEGRVGTPMAYDSLVPSYAVMESYFYTYAFQSAASEILSHNTTIPFGSQYLSSQLSPSGGTNVYAELFNYIKRCLRDPSPGLGLGSAFPANPILVNPQDWAAAASAWLQLAVENPGYFRKYERTNPGYPSRLDGIISKGSDLTNFFNSLVFSGASTNINWSLYGALESYYLGKLTAFTDSVRTMEQGYANQKGFALDLWRHWSTKVPRVAQTPTAVTVSPALLLPASPTGPWALAADSFHFLALRPDRTVAVYAVDADYSDAPTVPDNATNVISMAAGSSDNIVLQSGGNLVAWGSDASELLTPPDDTDGIMVAASSSARLLLRRDGTILSWSYDGDGFATDIDLVVVAGVTLTNIQAITASENNCLALRRDGTMVGWGAGIATPNVSNVVAIATGGYHCLGLRSDGTVIGWGDNSLGQTNTPAGATNVVAVAAGNFSSLALRADGSVCVWGNITSIPPHVTNCVAIAAAENYCLAMRADGSVIGWGANFEGHTPAPNNPTDIRAIASGYQHNVALRANGTLLAWGGNVPDSATNITAIAAGASHNLALRTNGTVVAWGDNSSGKCDVPSNATNIIAIGAGSDHTVVARRDGGVMSWGNNDDGQSTVPVGITNIVAVAAGFKCSLALRTDGKVFGWGTPYNSASSVPSSATNVVAIAACRSHALALKADGSVIAWGANDWGQSHVPDSATNVVAIAAGDEHSVALRADGTVVAWGRGTHGQTTLPLDATNVVAIAAGGDHTLFLTQPGPVHLALPGDHYLARASIPIRIGELLKGVDGLVLTNLDLGLHDAGIELSGAGALLTAVVELALPYTLENDDVLHGFLHGSESLMDLESFHANLAEEFAGLTTRPDAKSQNLGGIAIQRYLRFAERLEARLNDVAASGGPEIPRLVGHTMRLLSLLRDAWSAASPLAVESTRTNTTLHLTLYGEPYSRYVFQQCTNLTASAWAPCSATNIHTETDFTLPITAGPQRFYRAMLPSGP